VAIDIARVSLSERDIEDYLYHNPGLVKTRCAISIERWIGRQFRVPSGVIDLLGVTAGYNLAVVEIKLGAVDASALTQVSRYASDISSALVSLDLGHESFWEVAMVCVGSRIDHKTEIEAKALNIGLNLFRVELSVAVSLLDPTIETFEPFELLAQHHVLVDFAAETRELSRLWEYELGGVVQ
jgi:hypothetical protein